MKEEQTKVDKWLTFWCVPEEHHFECPGCGRGCVMHPRAQPVNVRHALPTCPRWDGLPSVEDGLNKFLYDAKVPFFVTKPS